MEGNRNYPVDPPHPYARFFGHSGTQHPTELTAALVLEAPDGGSDWAAVLKDGAGAVMALDQCVTRSAEGLCLQIDDAVARRTTA